MSRRLVVIVFLGGLLVAAGVLDRERREAQPAVLGDRQPFVMPVADPAGALSSTWFCPGGSATSGGVADVTAVVANPTDRPVSGRLVWVPSEGVARGVALELAPHSVHVEPARASIDAPFVGAVVEVDAGEVAVEHVVSSANGFDVAPCSPAASPTWYLARGATTRDAGMLLAVLNPFADDAVLDLSFATDEGRVEPPGLQGYVVPANSLRIINVGHHVRRRAEIATSVVARSGRVVVERVQGFDGTAGRAGLGLSLAVPEPGLLWHFPYGLTGEQVRQRIHVYNPGDREALVDVELTADDADPEPIELTVPPRSAVAVDIGETGRVEPGTVHASTVRSANDVPVVVEREFDAGPGGNRRGWASMPGSPGAFRRWLFAAGDASGALDYWLVLHNPGAGAVEVSVRTFGGGRPIDIPALEAIEIGPAGRVEVRLGEHLNRVPLPLLVESSGPIVAERDLYRVGAAGVSTSLGIPLAVVER